MSEPKRYIFRIRECGCVKPEHLEGKYAPSALIIEETEGRCGWVSYEDYDRLKAEVERLAMAGNQSIAVGTKLREMVGDHHWSLEFDRVRTDWYHASRGVLSRTQNPNTPPTAV
jgi:hypothetical protein